MRFPPERCSPRGPLDHSASRLHDAHDSRDPRDARVPREAVALPCVELRAAGRRARGRAVFGLQQEGRAPRRAAAASAGREAGRLRRRRRDDRRRGERAVLPAHDGRVLPRPERRGEDVRRIGAPAARQHLRHVRRGVRDLQGIRRAAGGRGPVRERRGRLRDRRRPPLEIRIHGGRLRDVHEAHRGRRRPRRRGDAAPDRGGGAAAMGSGTRTSGAGSTSPRSPTTTRRWPRRRSSRRARRSCLGS